MEILPAVRSEAKLGVRMTAQHELNFEVYPQDLIGYFTWGEAVKLVEELGKGWRMPTKDELNQMYLERKEIGGFEADYYWSSSEYNDEYAWYQLFISGAQRSDYKAYRYMVRPVRDIPLTRDHDETVEARLRIDPEYAVALYRLQRKQLTELEDRLEEYKSSYKTIMQEQCGNDERHCTCVPPLKIRVREMEAQNLNMMALFRDFYENGYDENECGEIILKYGGDA